MTSGANTNSTEDPPVAGCASLPTLSTGTASASGSWALAQEIARHPSIATTHSCTHAREARSRFSEQRVLAFDGNWSGVGCCIGLVLVAGSSGTPVVWVHLHSNGCVRISGRADSVGTVTHEAAAISVPPHGPR